MKQIYILIFSLIGIYSDAQTLMGQYEMINEKTVNGSKINDRANYTLVYNFVHNDKKSLQSLISGGGTILKDTLIIDERGELRDIRGEINKPSDAFFFKNFNDKTIRIQFALKNDIRVIKDSLPNFKWKIHNEFKNILGYNCKKATTITNRAGVEQNIIAWFTESLVYNDGPLDFNGLPGMILGLEIDKFAKIKFINIEKITENTIINEPADTLPSLSWNEYNLIYNVNEK